MNKTSIQLASVGSGMIAKSAVPAIKATNGIDCVAVCSRTEPLLKAFASSMGIERTYTSYSALLAEKGLDALYLATPNHLHVQQAKMALQEGKHLIIEKPVAVHAGDVEELIRSAKSAGVFFFEAISTLYLPTFRFIKENLSCIGKIKTVEIAYGKRSSRFDAYLRGETPNVFDPQKDGGALNDLGIYCIHAATALFGAPASVSYLAERGRCEIDLSGVMTLEYPDFSCTLSCAKNKDLKNGIFIVGEKGSITAPCELNALATVAVKTEEGEKTLTIPADTNRLSFEFTEFSRAIREKDHAFFMQAALQTKLAVSVLEQGHLR